MLAFMGMCGIKMRAWPTSHQKQILSQWMGCSRVIYNGKCDEQEYFFKFKCRFPEFAGAKVPVDQAYSQFKTEISDFLSLCPSEILRNSAVVWYQTMQKFFKGECGRPVKKKKRARESMWLTRELFSLNQNPITGKWQLFIGKKKNNIGFLSFEAHREFLIPASITIAKENGKYFVSFNYEDPKLSVKTQEELISELAKLPALEIANQTIGLDRGVVIPVQSSAGQSFDFTPEQKVTIERKQKKIKKWQRRLARQKLGSNRRKKVKSSIAVAHRKIADIRRDFAHKTTRTLVGEKDEHGNVIDNGIRIFTVEDLKITNMTKSPAPKPDEENPGHYAPNKSAAKAGLSQKILNSAWGMIGTFLSYKAAHAGKVCVKVSPRFSSQECAQCGHIHPDNRQTQSEFLCLKCGHAENADQNAAEVIRKRGVEEILKQATCGTQGSARRGTRKTLKASKPKVQTQRSENRRRQSNPAQSISEIPSSMSLGSLPL
jgi:putative transposase